MKTKNIYIVVLITLLIVACNSTEKTTKLTPKNTENNQPLDTIEIANDSLDYKIIILEIGFNSWLVSQRPRGYYSQNFLENRNQIMVREYNSRVLQPNRFNTQLYQMRIDYNNRTDYGYEVNYLLYHYLLFFQEKYNQNLRF